MISLAWIWDDDTDTPCPTVSRGQIRKYSILKKYLPGMLKESQTIGHPIGTSL